MALNFLKRFDKYLKEKGIKQNYISKMSTYKWICRKSNRTLQDEFTNENIFLQRDDIVTFNRKLVYYLIWYNTQRPHKSLNNLTPIEILSNIIRSLKCM
jgi:Integrase core domain.